MRGFLFYGVFYCVLTWLGVFLASHKALADDVRIYAAASLSTALQDIAQRFEKNTWGIL